MRIGCISFVCSHPVISWPTFGGLWWSVATSSQSASHRRSVSMDVWLLPPYHKPSNCGPSPSDESSSYSSSQPSLQPSSIDDMPPRNHLWPTFITTSIGRAQPPSKPSSQHCRANAVEPTSMWFIILLAAQLFEEVTPSVPVGLSCSLLNGRLCAHQTKICLALFHLHQDWRRSVNIILIFIVHTTW